MFHARNVTLQEFETTPYFEFSARQTEIESAADRNNLVTPTENSFCNINRKHLPCLRDQNQ